jgi:hypothetical protein
MYILAYHERRAALKVFSKPHPKMALYGYSISITLKVIYYVCGFCGVPNEMGKVMTPTGSILFPSKP